MVWLVGLVDWFVCGFIWVGWVWGVVVGLFVGFVGLVTCFLVGLFLFVFGLFRVFE